MVNASLFWSKVAKAGPDDCWPWVGATAHGYGRYNKRRAHRLALELSTGEGPGDRVVRHSCDNPICCNPSHLGLGTQADNIADAVARGRLANGSRNGRSRLSESQAHELRLNVKGLSMSELARAYGISKTAAYYIARGRDGTLPYGSFEPGRT